MARLQRAEIHWSLFLEQSLLTYKAGDVQLGTIAQLSNGYLLRRLVTCKAGAKCPADQKHGCHLGGAVAEQWKEVVGQRAQAPVSECAQVIATAWKETAATGRVVQEDKDVEFAFLTKPGKDIGRWEDLEKTITLLSHIGKAWANSISSSTCASSWNVYRPVPIWLAPWKKHVRDAISQLELASKPPQLSPRKVLDSPGTRTVGSGLSCRGVERSCQWCWRQATQARATPSETASEGLSPKCTSRWEYNREALRARCVSSFCMPSASRKPRKSLR